MLILDAVILALIHETQVLETRLGLLASIRQSTTRIQLGFKILLFQICISDMPRHQTWVTWPKHREMQSNDDSSLQPFFGLIASTVERSQLEKQIQFQGNPCVDQSSSV